MGQEIKKHKYSYNGKSFVVREHSNGYFYVFFEGIRKMNNTFDRLKHAVDAARKSIELHD